MKNFFSKMLATFDYSSLLEFGHSLSLTVKYRWTLISFGFSASFFPMVDKLFGLDAFAFGVLLTVFIFELTSGVVASCIKKDKFSSMKLSRFTFKAAINMLLISCPYVLATNFKAHDKTAIAFMFDWLYMFFVSQVVIENIVSILENLAVIQGKDKTHWISKIKEKFITLIS